MTEETPGSTVKAPAETGKRPALTLLATGGAGVCEGDACEIPVMTVPHPDEDTPASSPPELHSA